MNKIYICIKNKDDITISDDIKCSTYKDETKKAFSVLNNMLDKLDIKFDINSIKYKNNGKPYIVNSNIKFNYSHSKNYIACVVSNSELGIDIEDIFNISNKARSLYLNNIDSNYRLAWVKKEAYCKLLGTFDDEFFKQLDTDLIKENSYIISNDEYDCACYYNGDIKDIIYI